MTAVDMRNQNAWEDWLKCLVLLILIHGFCLLADAQTTYERKGNNFTLVTKTSKSEAQKTSFTFTDSKGNTYPIFITKNGRCFVNKVSSKTGKEYKYYLKEDLSKEICREIGIQYKPK